MTESALQRVRTVLWTSRKALWGGVWGGALGGMVALMEERAGGRWALWAWLTRVVSEMRG